MGKTTNNKPNMKNGLLTSILFFFFAVAVHALPSTDATNLQTTAGVSFSQSGSTLTFTTPDRAVLNWNNFGSGADAIGLTDSIKYVLPSSKASVLNVVAGSQTTTINGTIESNGGVYILNPNGIVIGNGARIDTARLVLSTVDAPFSGQYKFIQDGTLPSESGAAIAGGGNTTITGNALLLTPNIVLNTKDFSFYGGLTSGNLTVNANGSATLGSGVAAGFVSDTLTVNNPTGVTTLGQVGGYSVGANTAINLTTDTGSIINNLGAVSNTRVLNLTAGNSGTINLAAVSAPTVNATGGNVSVTFIPNLANATFNGTVTGNLSVSASGALTLNSIKNSGSGNAAFTAGGKLTLAGVHLNSSGTTTFTGASVVDSLANVFVYGPTQFTATATDIAITQAGHSFGPLSISAQSGNATVYEGAAINLNVATAKELTLKTREFFFQTPTTYSLLANKFDLTTLGNVTFTGGTINAGLTINAGSGNVDLSKLFISTNLNGVTPIITTTGTVSAPAAAPVINQ